MIGKTFSWPTLPFFLRINKIMEKNLGGETYALIPFVSEKFRQIILIFFSDKKARKEKTLGRSTTFNKDFLEKFSLLKLFSNRFFKAP